MVVCCNPSCVSNNDARDDVMHLEYADHSETWIPVCDSHVMDDRPSVEITQCVESIPAEVLTHIKEELAED